MQLVEMVPCSIALMCLCLHHKSFVNCKEYAGPQRILAFQMQACNKRVRSCFTSKLPQVPFEDIAEGTRHQLVLPQAISVIQDLAQLLLRILGAHKHKATSLALCTEHFKGLKGGAGRQLAAESLC